MRVRACVGMCVCESNLLEFMQVERAAAVLIGFFEELGDLLPSQRAPELAQL